VGTAALLLASRSNLPGLSRHVGRNIAFNGSVKAVALLPDDFPDGDMLSGRTHPGMISYEFLNTMGVTISAVKPMPLNIVSSAHLYLDGGKGSPAFWGESNVELMKVYRRRMIILFALGMTRPGAEITVDASGKCTPRLRIDSSLRRYHSQVKNLLENILTRSGCRLIRAPSIDREGREHADLFFGTAHMVGSCRMADSPRQGVVDSNGELFGWPGIHVTDGAAVPTSIAVNTSLTILANAERIAAQMVRRLGSGRQQQVSALARKSA
jgi:choline dehydrogenase-like flavoprotein